MFFDSTMPYDEVYGPCDVIPGAKFLQNGVYFDGAGNPLADINGKKLSLAAKRKLEAVHTPDPPPEPETTE